MTGVTEIQVTSSAAVEYSEHEDGVWSAWLRNPEPPLMGALYGQGASPEEAAVDLATVLQMAACFASILDHEVTFIRLPGWPIEFMTRPRT